MNRVEWTVIASAVADARSKYEATWPPRDGYIVTARDIHDRKLIYYATLDGFDRSTVALCRALRSRSSRFDGDRFMRLAGAIK